MENAELCDQVGRVLSRVDSKSLGDDLECLRELRDGQLLSRAKSTGEVVEEDRKGDFNCTATGDDLVGLENALDDAERVVHRALDLVEEEVIGSTEDHGLGLGGFHALKEGVVPIADALFEDLGAVAQV